MNTLPDAVADIRSAISDEAWGIDSFIDRLRADERPAAPFDPQNMAFCVGLSRELLGSRDARAHPQLVALGYWLRAASIERARAAYFDNEDAHTILVPRGRVFHVTPANIDTMFVYSWILALLVGNANVVRLSAHVTEGARRLLESVSRVICGPDFTDLRRRNHLIFTGHDDRISRALSSVADVRVVWGGDATIEHFREFALPARARDVIFPNRHSLAIIDAEAIRAAREEELTILADGFFNDAYWFDQGACSSPRIVMWQTSRGDRATDARRRFKAAVSGAIRRRSYQAETGAAIEKMVFGYRRAAVADGVRYEWDSNEATWVEIPDLAMYDRGNCGGGLFFEFVSHDLEADLTTFVRSEDQTAACYGLDEALVRSLARRLNGRGIDRWVPIGRALDFGRVWDGYDLLQEFARRVVIDLQGAGPYVTKVERGS